MNNILEHIKEKIQNDNFAISLEDYSFIQDGVEHNLIEKINNVEKTATLFYSKCYERIGDDKYKASNNFYETKIEIPLELFKIYKQK